MTIDGREPSSDSLDGLSGNEYASIAYEAILPWLERCRKRAYDEPELRDSIVQYLRLIKKMTGNDRRSECMKELEKLCLRDSNLVVAHRLAEALLNAEAFLVHDMWERIRDDLKENLKEDIILKNEQISKDAIRNCIRKKSGIFGLHYSFGHDPACLFVEADSIHGYIVGVRDEDERSKKK